MDRAAFAEQLEAEITRTEEAIVGMKAMTGPVSPDNAIGRVSRMDAIQNQSITEAALRKAQEKLDGLRRMRERLDEPDLGSCERCGTEIPMPRMLLMPQSRFCVRCAR